MGLKTAFQGYISPKYNVTLIDPNTGGAVDLTGATNLALSLQDKATSNVYPGSGTWTITSAASGKASYQWSERDVSVTGRFLIGVTVQLPGEAGPRAFQPDEVLILAFPGVVIVATQDSNLIQINGTAISPSNPLPVSIADGALATLGTTTDAAYSGSGAGGVISLLKAAYAVLSNMLAKLSIMVSTPGYATPYASNAGATAANADYVFKWGGSGTQTVNRWLVQNNSANTIYIELDAVSSTAGIQIPAGQAYTDYNLPISALHIWTTAITPVNAASGIVVRGWV